MCLIVIAFHLFFKGFGSGSIYENLAFICYPLSWFGKIWLFIFSIKLLENSWKRFYFIKFIYDLLGKCADLALYFMRWFSDPLAYSNSDVIILMIRNSKISIRKILILIYLTLKIKINERMAVYSGQSSLPYVTMGLLFSQPSFSCKQASLLFQNSSLFLNHKIGRTMAA